MNKFCSFPNPLPPQRVFFISLTGLLDFQGTARIERKQWLEFSKTRLALAPREFLQAPELVGLDGVTMDT
jgi:hypothetical protein